MSSTYAPAAHPASRPWRELVEPLSSFSRPCSLGDAAMRARRNLGFFRVNYAMAALGVLFLSLLWHPLSMIAFLAASAAWLALYFLRGAPLELCGRAVDDRLLLAALSAATAAVVALTGVWLNVLVSALVAAAVIGLHAVFRGTEDLYCDEQEAAEGGLLSVVGSPMRTRYGRV